MGAPAGRNLAPHEPKKEELRRATHETLMRKATRRSRLVGTLPDPVTADGAGRITPP